MKIAVLTCYFDPDYVRARSLRAALRSLPDVEVLEVKNHQRGLLRYPEFIWRLWRVRRERPDAYLLTFRGQEVLPLVLLLAGSKPVLFDEFIVPLAYATGEPHAPSLAVKLKHVFARVNQPFYCRWLRRCHTILSDTAAHADLSAEVNNVPRERYLALPVGTDETLFTPPKRAPAHSQTFRVFYYSSGMQPLHGVPVVLAAAERLQANPNIDFFLVGGKQSMEQVVQIARDRGANMHYAAWIPFDDLTTAIHSASLCLGGPFGDTQQARHVITGKTYQFLACAAPTVVGKGLATGEFFHDKRDSLLVPQGDVEALANVISWAYDNPAALQQIGRAGRELYEREFSIGAIARRLQPLLARL